MGIGMDIFKKDNWHSYLRRTAGLRPEERYEELLKLHVLVLYRYAGMVSALAGKDAEDRPGQKSRSRKSIVAHIFAWEEWQLDVFEDKNMERRLEEQLDLQGYVDKDIGKVYDFGSVDDFNAYQDRKYRNMEWGKVQARALDTARRFQNFFVESHTGEFIGLLEKTPAVNWKGIHMTIPSGWYLWMISLDHEAVAHAEDLTI